MSCNSLMICEISISRSLQNCSFSSISDCRLSNCASLGFSLALGRSFSTGLGDLKFFALFSSSSFRSLRKSCESHSIVRLIIQKTDLKIR